MTARQPKPHLSPGTVTDQLDILGQLLGDIATQLERIADTLEAVAPRDLSTKDKRYLRTQDTTRAS